QNGKRSQRDTGKAPLLGRIGQLTVEHAADAHPQEPRACDLPRRTRPTVERLLELPRRAVKWRELALHRLLVRLQARGTSTEEVKDRRSGEPRRDEALVHAVARDRVDQAGGVADEQWPFGRNPGALVAERQPMPAQLLELGGVEAVGLTGATEVALQLGPLTLPAADADVRVVAFREDPGVASGDVGELEHESAGVALPGEGRVLHVPLVRHAVRDAVSEADGPRGDSVRPVGSDESVCGQALAADIGDRGAVARLDLHPDTLADIHSACPGGVEQKG